MAVLARPDRVRLTAHRALPGLGVARFTSEGHLYRSVSDRYATVLHLAGRSECTSGRARWTTGPGTLALKVPGEVYTETAREGRAEMQVVRFDDALVETARTALAPHVAAPKDHAIDARDPRVRAIVRLHRRLLDPAPAPELEQVVCESLTALVELTSHAQTRVVPSACSAAVSRARALLDARLTETVTLDELASHARLDKFRLCRAFRDEIGLPPHAYVTHRRMTYAQELLARGVPQGEVAVTVGLYDQSQLHRHFKRILGLTPGAFARATR